MEFMVNRMFNSAEKEVWIIQPYTFIDDKILAYVKTNGGPGSRSIYSTF